MYEKPTVLTIAINVLLGIAGLDLPSDLRDLAASIIKFDNTPKAWFNLIINIIAIIPFIGDLKYLDQAVDAVEPIVKNGDEAAELAADILKKNGLGDIAEDIIKNSDEAADIGKGIDKATEIGGDIAKDSDKAIDIGGDIVKGSDDATDIGKDIIKNSDDSVNAGKTITTTDKAKSIFNHVDESIHINRNTNDVLYSSNAIFATEDKLISHFEKHKNEFKGLYNSADEYLQGARDVINNGYKVKYMYKGEQRIGYIKFMGNDNKGIAKFALVGTNNEGYITTFHTESGKSFWKLLNGENIPVINPQ